MFVFLSPLTNHDPWVHAKQTVAAVRLCNCHTTIVHTHLIFRYIMACQDQQPASQGQSMTRGAALLSDRTRRACSTCLEQSMTYQSMTDALGKFGALMQNCEQPPATRSQAAGRLVSA